jgi:hypothetical protein
VVFGPAVVVVVVEVVVLLLPAVVEKKPFSSSMLPTTLFKPFFSCFWNGSIAADTPA